MLLHPGILALITGSTVTLLLLLFAAALGMRILRKWDITSNSEEQLLLERRTYLVSTLVQYGLLFQVLSVFLFIYTADDIHNLLVGAMCATGSLNANAYGFPALYAGICSLFLAGAWIALNRLDSTAEDYPLTRKKYMLLLFVVPVVLTGYVLQIRYFMNLDPNVITSCCGVLFSEGGSGVAGSLASLPVKETEAMFFSLFLLLLVSGIAVVRKTGKPFTQVLSFLSASFFIVSIAAVVSFISLYFYQLPTHHCPFDILQSGYYYVGYPLYGSLFTGSFFGMMTGIIEPLKKIPSLSAVIPSFQRRWAVKAIIGTSIFVAISLFPMLFLPFTLTGY